MTERFFLIEKIRMESLLFLEYNMPFCEHARVRWVSRRTGKWHTGENHLTLHFHESGSTILMITVGFAAVKKKKIL